jgi:hypothetical protein
MWMKKFRLSTALEIDHINQRITLTD